MPARTPALLAAALLALFLWTQGAWLERDRLVRDGDEEGHVGAAELFVADLRAGDWGTWAARALWQDMGDYPALYPAVVGTGWWLSGEGQPERWPVRGLNTLFPLLAALGVYGAGRRMGLPAGAAGLGAVSTLFVPLGAGLSRHFMPEGAVAAVTALAVWAAAAQDPRRSLGPGLALGLALGAGVLTKQTFVLGVLAPLVYLVRPGPALVWVGLGASVAAPWVLNNLEEQRAYAAQSAGYAAEAGWAAHAAYYPVELGLSALGPVWVLLLLGLVAVGWRGPGRAAVKLGLVWGLGGLVVLGVVPKKYDRLLAPVLPAVGLVLGGAVASRPRAAAAAVLPAAWTVWVSFAESPFNRPSGWVEDFHPGCAQRWIRPPDGRDLGYAALAARLESAPPGPVAVLSAPEIPCALRTTFGWAYHLEPFLRREGLERAVTEEPRGAAWVVDFAQPGGERLDVPLLGVEAGMRAGEPPRRER